MRFPEKMIGSTLRIGGYFLVALFLFLSCENDIETINALSGELNMPSQSGYDVETVYHDSGYIQGKIMAPEVNRYDHDEAPYIEFPGGLEVFFYDDSEQVESYIQADYAINYVETRMWEARSNVVAVNQLTGEKLETEQLFWDQDEQIIWSEKFSVITNPDGVFYGENGFDANQDMTDWTLRRSRGTAFVEDLEDENDNETE